MGKVIQHLYKILHRETDYYKKNIMTLTTWSFFFRSQYGWQFKSKFCPLWIFNYYVKRLSLFLQIWNRKYRKYSI